MIRPKKTAIMAGIAPLLVAGACALDVGEPEPQQHDGSQNSSQSLLDGQEEFGEGVTPFAEVEVADSRFTFVEVDAEDGEFLGVGSVNTLGPISAAASQDPKLEGASPLDLFLAITPAETPIPTQLTAFEQTLAEPRGWLVEKMESPDVTSARGICQNSTFRSAINNIDPDINDEEDWSLNQTPSSGNLSRWRGPTCHPGTSECSTKRWHSYNMRAGENTYDIHNLDEASMGAVACQMESARAFWSGNTLVNPHSGPELRFTFRTSAGSTGHVFQRDLTQDDRLRLFTWVWWGNPVVASQHNVDWRISWDEVRGGDKFDMGMRGEHRGW